MYLKPFSLFVVAVIPSEGYTLDVDQIYLAALGDNADPTDSFVGHMRNFVFDGHRFFEDTDIPWPPPGHIPMYKITFRSPTDAYVTLPGLYVGEDFEISFMFKTQERNGLLLYNGGGGLSNDFLAVELVNGYIYLIFDDGTGTKTIKANTPRPLGDDEWHFVKISRPASENFAITVDETVTTYPRDLRKATMELRDELYIGGVTRNMYPNLPEQITSEHGFRGCMASVTIEKRLVDVLADALSTTAYVSRGCTCKLRGLYSLSGRTSYRKISRSLEAARFGFRLFRLLWNLTGTSAAALPRCL